MAWCSCQYCKYINLSNRWCNYYGAYADTDLGKHVFSFDECPAYEDHDSSDYDSGSSDSGCFMTSACCDYLKKDDKCVELEAMRNFRDTYLINTEEGKELIKEYYFKAPKIVEFINNNPLRDYFYQDIYESICKCKTLIEAGKNDEAIDTYYQMFRKYLRISGCKK